MQDKEFYQDAQNVCANAIDLLLKSWTDATPQNVCANAIDLLLKSWTDATPAATMRETLQGLNGLKDYFAAQQ